MSVSAHRKKLFGTMEEDSLTVIYSGIPIRSNADEYYDFDVNSNFFYLTNLERYGMILLLAKVSGQEREVLFIEQFDPLTERWTGKMPTPEEVTAISGIKEVKFVPDFENVLGYYMTRFMISKVYFDTSRESIADLPDYNLVQAQKFAACYPAVPICNLYPVICPIRRIKDEEEITDVRNAIGITKKGLEEVLGMLKPGVMEYQVQAAFEYRCHYEGAKKMAFPTIAGSGKNGCMMHYGENDHPVKDDGLILLDLGAKYHNYCSDISRTYPVSGKYSSRQRTYYELVLKANREVAKAARPGITLRDLQNLTCDILAEGLMAMGKISSPSEIRKYYMHSVSHSIGIDCHDINYGNEVLEPGWIISDEPGLYIDEEAIGIRIEDDLLITETGCEVLSESIIRDPDEIEAFMAAGKTV